MRSRKLISKLVILKIKIAAILFIGFVASGISQIKPPLPVKHKNYRYKMNDSISNRDSVLDLTLSCWSCVGKQKAKFQNLLQNIDTFPNLQNLWIEGGRSNLDIGSLDVPLNKIPRLKEVMIYGYDLKNIPDWILKDKHLERLNFRETLISEISPGISNLSNLKYFSFCGIHRGNETSDYYKGYKQVASLPNEFSLLKKLEELEFIYVDFNNWSDVFKIISKLPNLKKLRLTDCNIDTLSGSVGLLKNISELYLQAITGFDGNWFAKLPKEIYQLKNLKKLYLGYAFFKDRMNIQEKLPPGCKLEIYESCFPKDAKVLLPSGQEKPITAIHVGDKIASYDPEKKSKDAATVILTQTHTNSSYSLYKIEFADLPLLASEMEYFSKIFSFVATPNHPVILASGIIKQVSDLCEGDVLLFSSGNEIRSAKVIRINKNYMEVNMVYDIVTDKGNYFIDDICVSNK